MPFRCRHCYDAAVWYCCISSVSYGLAF